MTEKFCKDCKWARPGYIRDPIINWTAKCGRKLNPVTGDPDVSCSDERAGGLWKLNNCGAEARFWEPQS